MMKENFSAMWFASWIYILGEALFSLKSTYKCIEILVHFVKVLTSWRGHQEL